MIKRGDVVRFKPEWQDDGDADIVFIAMDDESMGRVSVSPQLGLPMNPVQTVAIEMLELA